MNTPNFGALLDRPSSEVERPKPAPVGSYTTILVGLPRQDKSSKKQTEFVEFTHKFIAAGEDVDPDALEAYLTSPDGTKRPLTEITMKNTYYITENSLWRLKDFLTDCGIEEGDASLRQRLEETAGAQVGVFIRHEASEDGTNIFARIGKTFAIE